MLMLSNVVRGLGLWCKNVWEPLLYKLFTCLFRDCTYHVWTGRTVACLMSYTWGHCSWDGRCTEWWTNGSTEGSHKSPGTLPITWLRHLPSYCPVCPALTRLTVRLTQHLVTLGLSGGTADTTWMCFCPCCMVTTTTLYSSGLKLSFYQSEPK